MPWLKSPCSKVAESRFKNQANTCTIPSNRDLPWWCLCLASQKLEALPRAIFPSSNQSPRGFQGFGAPLHLQSPPHTHKKNSNGLGQGCGQGHKKFTMWSLNAFLTGDQDLAPSWCHSWVEVGSPGDGQPLPPWLLFWPLCSSLLFPSGFSPFSVISGFLR